MDNKEIIRTEESIWMNNYLTINNCNNDQLTYPPEKAVLFHFL